MANWFQRYVLGQGQDHSWDWGRVAHLPQTVGEATLNATKAVGGAILPDQVGQALKEDQQYASDAHQAIAAGILAASGEANPDNPSNNPLANATAIFQPKTWQDAWHATHNGPDSVTAGQAIIGPLFDSLPGSGRTPTSGVSKNRSDSVFHQVTTVDPVTGKATQTRPYFTDSFGAGQIATGATDLFISTTVDPLVGVGQGVRLARQGLRGTTLEGEVSRKGAAYHLEQQKTQVGKFLEGDSTPIGDTLARGVEVNVNAPPSHAVAYWLSKVWVKDSTNPVGLAGALARAKDNQTIANVYLYSQGVPEARTALEAEQAQLVNDLDRAQSVLNNAEGVREQLGQTDRFGNVTATWRYNENRVQAAQEALNDAKARDAYLSKVLSNRTGESIEGSTNRVPIAQNRLLNALDEARSPGRLYRMTGSWDTATTRLGMLDRPIRVINFARSEEANGVVFVDGARVVDAHKELVAYARKAGLSQATTEYFLGRFALSGTSSERTQVLHDLEDHVFEKAAEEFGYDDPKAVRDLVMNAHDERRDDLIREARDAGGTIIDPDTGEAKVAKWMDSVHGNAIPLVDIPHMREILKSHKETITLVSKLQARAETGYNAGNAMVGALYDLWKPAVLLRLGYGQRNVAQNILDGWIAKGTVAGNAAAGSLNLLRNDTWFVGRKAQNARIDARRQMIEGNEHRPGQIQHWQNIQAQAKEILDGISPEGVREAEDSPGYVSFPNKGFYNKRPEKYGSLLLQRHVQLGVSSPTDSLLPVRQRLTFSTLQGMERQGTLTPELEAKYRILYAKASRRLLTEKKKEGNDLAYRNADGELIHVTKAADIPDEVLFPIRQSRSLNKGSEILGEAGSARPEAQVFILPKYKGAVQAVIAQGKRVDDVIAHSVGLGRKNPHAVLEEFDTEQNLIDRARAQESYDGATAMIDKMRLELQKLTPKDKLRLGEGEVTTSKGLPRYDPEKYFESPLGGVQITHAESFGDTFAEQARINGGVEATTAAIRTSNHANIRQRVYGRELQRSGVFSKYSPGDDDYWTMMHTSLTHYFANGIITRPLLEGQSVDEVVATLEKNVLLRRELGYQNLEHDELWEKVDEAQRHIDRLFPDKNLQLAAVTGKGVSEHDVVDALAGRDDLVPVSGEDVQASVNGNALGKLGDFLDNALVAPAFKFLNTLPENNLVAWPFYNAAFNMKYQDLVHKNEDFLEQNFRLDTNGAKEYADRNFRPAAHQYALAEINRVLYRVDRRYSLAGKLAYLAPFLQVMMNRTAFYGTQLLENPQQLAKIMVGWDAIGHDTDSEGNHVVTAHIPGKVRHLIGAPDFPLQFRKQSFNIMFSGQPWYSPGFGPIATVPAAYMLGQHPTAIPPAYRNLLTKMVVPYYSTSVTHQLLPSALTTWMDDQDSPQYANNLVKIAAYEQYQYESGQRSDPPTPDEIKKKADGMHLFKFLSRTMLPAQGNLVTPLQPMIDNYIDMQRQYGSQSPSQQQAWDMYKKQPGNEKTSFASYQRMYGPDARFYALHPDYYDFIVYTLNRNDTSIDSTDSAQKRLEANSNLASSVSTLNPRLVGLLANTPGDTGSDTIISAFQRNRAVAPGASVKERSSISPQEAYIDRQVSRGYLEYGKYKSAIDAILAQRKANGGSDNMSQKGNEDLQFVWSSLKAKIFEGNQEFANAYGEHDDMRYAKNAEGVAKIAHSDIDSADPWRAQAMQYLEFRALIKKELLDRAKVKGGSADLTAITNHDLAFAWTALTNQLVQANPLWGQVYNSFLEGDTIQENTVTNGVGGPS